MNMATLAEALNELVSARKEIAALNLKVESLDKRVTNNEGGITTVRKNASNALTLAKDAKSKANTATALTNTNKSTIDTNKISIADLKARALTTSQKSDLKKLIAAFSDSPISQTRLTNVRYLTDKKNFESIKYAGTNLGTSSKFKSKVEDVVSVGLVKKRATGSFVSISDWNKNFLPLRNVVNNDLIPDLTSAHSKVDKVKKRLECIKTHLKNIRTQTELIRSEHNNIAGIFDTLKTRMSSRFKDMDKIYKRANALDDWGFDFKKLAKFKSPLKGASGKTSAKAVADEVRDRVKVLIQNLKSLGDGAGDSFLNLKKREDKIVTEMKEIAKC